MLSGPSDIAADLWPPAGAATSLRPKLPDVRQAGQSEPAEQVDCCADQHALPAEHGAEDRPHDGRAAEVHGALEEMDQRTGNDTTWHGCKIPVSPWPPSARGTGTGLREPPNPASYLDLFGCQKIAMEGGAE